jgi:short-subunit dehydrogenase
MPDHEPHGIGEEFCFAMDIPGRVIVITGASSGIGLATARRAAALGAQVALVARSADVLGRLAAELNEQGATAAAFPADLRDPAQARHAITAAAERFGRIDVLINNAGQSAAGHIADVDLDDFRQIVELNVFGPVAAMQAVIPLMRAQGGGVVVNVSSNVSRMQIPGLGAYAATKGALNMVSATAQGELAPEHIRVLTVYPRLTETAFGQNALGSQQIRDALASSASRRQMDSPELVAERILMGIESETPEISMDDRLSG